MVGICGSLGREPGGTEQMADLVPSHAATTTRTYEDDHLSLWTGFHDRYDDGQPAVVDDADVSLWVWGDVYGYEHDGTYSPRESAPGDSARYCADLYAAHGMEFVDGLNGDFALLVLDREAGTLSFVTDRLATRPVYYARPDEDRFVFASTIQALVAHPDVTPTFDTELLYEYLVLRRVFGIETPLEGIRELPPASVVTVDLADGSTTAETYWRPRHRPVDRSGDEIVADLRDTFAAVLDEWTDPALDCGVLLSGGSDSRAVLAGLDQPVDAFHITDWMSRETRISQQVAEASGDEFHLLKRDLETDAAILGESPSMSNFSGWFDQAYFATFEDEIRDDVDILLSGLYADMLFGGGPLGNHSLSLGPLGTVTLPTHKAVESVDDYVAAQTAEAVEPVPYVTESLDIATVIGDRIHDHGDYIESHGVRYDSVRDLVMYGDYYPMGADTDAIFSRSLMHLRPYRTPFLDNRLLDLQQQVPREQLLWRNLIHQVVDDLDPSLGDIPHARTGIPLKYPFPVHYVGENLNQFHWKHLASDEPAPHLDHGPWPDRNELVRQSEFTIDTIRANEELLERLPLFDFEGAVDCYQRHLDDQNNVTLLYSLLTLIEMPATREIAADRAEAASGSLSNSDD